MSPFQNSAFGPVWIMDIMKQVVVELKEGDDAQITLLYMM